ncbi:MAG TPA: hypothetical protein ENG11_00065, partial [candidate division Zixibacteria bacterium]|nr:hypothetical protein [candidate division Zixibacteria bacterium]
MRRFLVVGIALLLAAFVGAQEYDTLFFDGFESGDLGEWQEAIAPVQWHITSGSHAIDGNSWWSGNEDMGGYSDYWMHLLVTPEIELPASPDGNLTLSASVDISVEGPPDSPVALPLGEGETLWVDGWDGCQVRITTDGGETWHILEPEGGYPYHMMYGFLINEGDTSVAAGWGGTFSGDVTFDLSDYTGQTVQIAFVMASDVSWNTADDPSLFGFVVDDIEVADASTSYFLEDADDHTTEMDTINMSFAPPLPVVTDVEAYEGTYSMFAQNDYNMVYAVVTPPVHLPDDFLGTVSYRIYRDAPDYDGDGDSYLEDYYLVFVSTDGGLSWNRLIYDWYHEGSDPEWALCEHTEGYNATWEAGLDLYDYRGEDVMIKFLFLFDDNDDGGAGTGFYVDNIAIYGVHGFNHDAGIAEIVTGPVNLGEPVVLNFGVMGYGVETATPRAHYAIYDSATGTEIASDDLGLTSVGLFEEKFLSTTWTPDAPGTYNIVAWTTYPLDEDNSNDTAMITLHIEENLWELGYDDGVPDTYSIIIDTTVYGPFMVFLNGLGDTIDTYQDGIAVQFDSPFENAHLVSLSFRGVGRGNVAFKIFEYNETDGVSGFPDAEFEFTLPDDFPVTAEHSQWITFPVEEDYILPEQFAILVCAADEESWVNVSADRDATEFRTYLSEYDPTFGFYTHNPQNMFVPYIDSVGAMIRCVVSGEAPSPAPVVLGTEPTEGSYTACADQTITFWVSSDLDPSSVVLNVNGATYTSSSPEVSVNPDMFGGDSAWAVVFTPSEDFTDGETVTAELSEFTDAAGNPGRPVTVEFYVDLTPPQITSVSPAEGESTSVTPTIEVTIEETGSGVDASSLRFEINGEEVTPDVSFTGTGAIASYTPTTPFGFSEEVTVRVIGLQDSPDYCEPNVAAEYEWSFVTPPPAPVVLGTEPTEGSYTACADQTITFWVSSDLDPSSVVLNVNGATYTS